MKCELVGYTGGSKVNIPSVWGQPRADQMQGSLSEQLVELCGRGCYDSLGTGRGSKEYHQHLLEAKHYSVHEHVHFTIQCPFSTQVLIGIPDLSVWETAAGRSRITLNLRHCLEWPNNVTYRDDRHDMVGIAAGWKRVFNQVASRLMPNVLPPDEPTFFEWSSVKGEIDTEIFVSLFLEDSRVWSHEMVRHRHNMSQRSGRFCDETDRDYAIHPLLKEYLNEAGYLALNPEDGEKLWCDPKEGVTQAQILNRTTLGNHLGSFVTQSRMTYAAVVEHLQNWMVDSKGMDKFTARKQSRSAARYYLGNGLSTELLFSASIRGWRDIFSKRINPGADAAIAELMTAAKETIRNSPVGNLL